MAQDIMSQFYTSLNLPLQEKLLELTRIIDQSTPNKDLQAMFPQLVNNIFSSTFTNGWGLKTITFEANRYEFEALIGFLEPQGPMFRLCYKLLSDPQLKYNVPLNVLPLDLQLTLQKGRCPQFYADMLTVDSQTLNIVALALNPFDYYIFEFALHLVNNNQNKSSWENWNSVYFALACDYLMHFLPCDPNMPVLPLIPNYTGKVPVAAPLQTSTRPFCHQSLLIIADFTGVSNQHSSPQNQSRHELWRSETVLQVFVDMWMSVEVCQNSYTNINSSPERVRTVRVLVKHIHSYSSKCMFDSASRSLSLRTYALQLMCPRAYQYIKHLVLTWPLDASFRLVMELWLSLIQPWRYVDKSISQDRVPGLRNAREEVDNLLRRLPLAIPFIAENFPSYTCIFQLILPRFITLDLTEYKNAIMLFRLGKVFSQQQLCHILRHFEQAITENNLVSQYSFDSSFSGIHDQSLTFNDVPIRKWVPVAKQALSELNLSANFEYEPIWSENKKQFGREFLKKIFSEKLVAEKKLEECNRKLILQQQGLWGSIKHWLMLGSPDDNEKSLEDLKKVVSYLNSTIHFFSEIFELNEVSVLSSMEPIIEDVSLENSSFANSTNFPLNITNRLRSKPSSVHYMGDPDLMPIASYESTILVRMLYQIAARLNELYGQEFQQVWNSDNFLGYVSREVLQKPCVIHTYVKEVAHQHIAEQELPPRLSLRRLGSHMFVAWLTIGYLIFRFFSYSGIFYLFFCFVMWTLFTLTKASLKMIKIMNN